jgi:hypothetical protein
VWSFNWPTKCFCRAALWPRPSVWYKKTNVAHMHSDAKVRSVAPSADDSNSHDHGCLDGMKMTKITVGTAALPLVPKRQVEANRSFGAT